MGQSWKQTILAEWLRGALKGKQQHGVALVPQYCSSNYRIQTTSLNFVSPKTVKSFDNHMPKANKVQKWEIAINRTR